jgi:hypothetical protein
MVGDSTFALNEVIVPDKVQVTPHKKTRSELPREINNITFNPSFNQPRIDPKLRRFS